MSALGGKRTLGNVRLDQPMIASGARSPAAAILLLLTGACAREDKAQAVTLQRVKYEFPSQDVRAISLSEFDDYVRLKPSDEYLIIYSKRKNDRPNDLGPVVPTLAHINDVPQQKVEVIHSPDGAIVCGEPAGLKFECGMRIVDAGLFWSLAFDRAKIADAHRIHAEAANKLASYRG